MAHDCNYILVTHISLPRPGRNMLQLMRGIVPSGVALHNPRAPRRGTAAKKKGLLAARRRQRVTTTSRLRQLHSVKLDERETVP